MKETQLKKQFSERDLKRMRNIIQKKYNDKTVTSVGYTKAEIQHEEGDVWEENGRSWTIKNGIKRNVRKTESLAMPLLCPSCNNDLVNGAYVMEDGTIQNWAGNGLDTVQLKQQILDKLQKIKEVTETIQDDKTN